MISIASVVLTFALGMIAGLRSMTPPAVVAWASWCGWLRLDGTPFAFLGSATARYLLAACMVGELIADKLPFTPSRTRPGPFTARIVTGGLSGAAYAAGSGWSAALGGVIGALGAVAGTLGGYRARTGLVRRLQVPDYVIALLEDLVAVGGAVLIVAAQR
jgi:uncharacterized membrane protein